jgi:MFS family permease
MEDARAVGPRYKWYVVGMLWFTGFFNYADRQAIFSLFPLLEKQLHLDSVQLGMLGSSFALVYGLSGPFAGNIVDRVRRKAAVLGGLYAWSLICMATALSRNFRQLLFFRAAEGLGETFYFPAAMSIVSDYHGKNTRSRAMGLHQTSVYTGIIAGGFFGGLLGQYYGWRLSFVVFGGLGILLGLVLSRFLVEPRRGATDLAEAGARAEAVTAKMSLSGFLKVVVRTPTVMLLMAAFMLENFCAMVLFTWMPKFLYDKFSFSLAMAGLTATVYIQFASMAGSPLGGWLADIMRRRTPGGRMIVQAMGLAGAAPFVVLCATTHSVGWLIFGLISWGLIKSFYEGNIFASVFDVIRPEARGTAVGFMNMIGWLVGGGSAPIVIGLIARHNSLSFAIATAATAYVLGSLFLIAGVLLFVRRDSERVRAELAAEGR